MDAGASTDLLTHRQKFREVTRMNIKKWHAAGVMRQLAMTQASGERREVVGTVGAASTH